MKISYLLHPKNKTKQNKPQQPTNHQQILLSHQQQQQLEQQQQQQLELQQLSYASQLQTLPNCNSTASTSSSPTCHSPNGGSGAATVAVAAAATAGQIALLNGSSNHSETDIANEATAAYHHHHQLTIIAPIVITPASMVNGEEALPLSTALQPIHASEVRTTSIASALNGIDVNSGALRHNLTHHSATQPHSAHLLSHTALTYAPNAATATYLISGSGGPAVIGGSSSVGNGSIGSNINDHITANGNPLCSFSEVTNTLLNQ
ncbi:myb-like protein Q [Anastrepha ludens]|uniref:myb-like protein Q n=1 Tax=Anastrepha ludens TaxID=28586 RepID=UPI0023AFEE05|nr:myb-like protein Q [Anastrepha ludens]